MKWGDIELSKLELYIEILKIIGRQRLVQLTAIQEKTSINLDCLKERIAFLVEQGLIEQRNTTNQLVYKNTQRGIRVLKYFRELKQMLPIS